MIATGLQIAPCFTTCCDFRITGQRVIQKSLSGLSAWMRVAVAPPLAAGSLRNNLRGALTCLASIPPNCVPASSKQRCVGCYSGSDGCTNFCGGDCPVGPRTSPHASGAEDRG